MYRQLLSPALDFFACISHTHPHLPPLSPLPVVITSYGTVASEMEVLRTAEAKVAAAAASAVTAAAAAAGGDGGSAVTASSAASSGKKGKQLGGKSSNGNISSGGGSGISSSKKGAPVETVDVMVKKKRQSGLAFSSSGSSSGGKPSSSAASSASKRGSPLFGVVWTRVVLDEAHTIRNRATKIAQGCCRLAARYRWALTGTPLQNSLQVGGEEEAAGV